MRRIGTIGMVLFLGLVVSLPTMGGAEPQDADAVTLYIRGGIGVTVGVINEGNETVTAKSQITYRNGIFRGNMTVDPQTQFERTISSPRFTTVLVKVSCGNETQIRYGFTLLFFTYLFIPIYS